MPDIDFTRESDEYGRREHSQEFLQSLEAFSESDIPDNERNRRRKRTAFDYMRYAVMVLCLAVFLYSGGQIVYKLYEYAQGRSVYNSLRDTFNGGGLTALGAGGTQAQDADGAMPVLPTIPDAPMDTLLGQIAYSNGNVSTGADVIQNGGPPSSGAQTPGAAPIANVPPGVTVLQNGDLSQMLPRLQRIYAINSDFVCWIKIDNTTVDYPVVQAADNDYYLTHAFDNTYLKTGSIFADCRCDRDFLLNYNTVIYGHNMNDGSMFHSIINFANNPGLLLTTKIYLYTLDGTYVYQPFTFYRCSPSYRYIQTQFDTTDDWGAFLQEVTAKSMIDLGVSVTPGDRIITLSTCTNTRINYRYSLQAKLVEIIT